MATYLELKTASENGPLIEKIRVAVIIAAETIRTESTGVADHAARLTWAKAAYLNPVAEANRMVWAVLAQNKAVALASITGASDATIQTAVDAAVNVFAVG